MRGARACIGGWRGKTVAVLMVVTVCQGLPHAHAQPRDTVWLTTSRAGHDVLANCLAGAMSGEFITAPVVFAPPRRAAYVNVWPRARQPVDPVATFHVEPDKDGKWRIGWQRLTDAPAAARWDAAAKTAATRCANVSQ